MPNAFSGARRCVAALTLVLTASGVVHAATATQKVRMYWTFGTIDVELYGSDSPRNVANFLRYADADRYDSTFVHRVDFGTSTTFVQGGGFYVPTSPTVSNLVTSPVPTFGPVKNEFDASNGLSNTPGSLAAARTSGGPDTATAQWFFNVSNNAAGFDPGPYTVYGQITDGFDWFQNVPLQPQLQDVNPSAVGTYQATTPLVYGSTLVVLTDVVEIPLQPGDFNLDGYVDQLDRIVWQAAEGTTDNLTADANGDHLVNADDLAVWQANLGQGNPTPYSAGDYNRDRVVDTADYLWWETTMGSTTSLYADGNGDGVVDTADYTVWRDAMSAASTAFSVPEPSALGLALAGILATRRRPDAQLRTARF